MGFVRKSQRKSGLTQKSNVTPPTPQPLAPCSPSLSRRSHPAKAEVARKRALLQGSARFSFPVVSQSAIPEFGI
jgi:hypothetical protein